MSDYPKIKIGEIEDRGNLFVEGYNQTMSINFLPKTNIHSAKVRIELYTGEETKPRSFSTNNIIRLDEIISNLIKARTIMYVYKQKEKNIFPDFDFMRHLISINTEKALNEVCAEMVDIMEEIRRAEDVVRRPEEESLQ